MTFLSATFGQAGVFLLCSLKGRKLPHPAFWQGLEGFKWLVLLGCDWLPLIPDWHSTAFAQKTCFPLPPSWISHGTTELSNTFTWRQRMVFKMGYTLRVCVLCSSTKLWLPCWLHAICNKISLYVPQKLGEGLRKALKSSLNERRHCCCIVSSSVLEH